MVVKNGREVEKMINGNEREILAGENRFYLGKDNIIYVTLKGKIDYDTLLKMRGAFFKILIAGNEKCNILAINKKTENLTLNFKKIFKEVSECDNFGKVAVLNLNPKPSGFSSLVARLSKNENLDFFDSREDALSWLNEGVMDDRKVDEEELVRKI